MTSQRIICEGFDILIGITVDLVQKVATVDDKDISNTMKIFEAKQGNRRVSSFSFDEDCEDEDKDACTSSNYKMKAMPGLLQLENEDEKENVPPKKSIYFDMMEENNIPKSKDTVPKPIDMPKMPTTTTKDIQYGSKRSIGLETLPAQDRKKAKLSNPIWYTSKSGKRYNEWLELE